MKGGAVDKLKLIFPVFAGMIPDAQLELQVTTHFPRIRGDDPKQAGLEELRNLFSPYSRG